MTKDIEKQADISNSAKTLCIENDRVIEDDRGGSLVNANAALKSYTNVHYQTQVAGANPHRLIQMLYEGALERIAQAKGAMQQKNIGLKGKKIADAINIILALRENLDFDQGGELAHNLDALYDYMTRTLWQAHSDNDEALLEEVSGLIHEVYSAWKQIK